MWNNFTQTIQRTTRIYPFPLFLVLLLIAGACSDDVRITHTYTYFEPVYKTTNEIREAFDIIEPQVIHSPGKIYYLNGYIFLNEPGKGIHIINNTDPSNPVNEAFINIPGNFDMAAKGHVLYADSYIDLLAIDLSDFQNPTILKRVENVFPLQYYLYTDSNNDQEIILTEYKEVKQVTVYEDDLGGMAYPGLYYYERGFIATSDFAAQSASFSSLSGNQAGIGGSMARFTIMEDHLYTVDFYNMNVFDIVNIEAPEAGEVINIGWDIETIFPYEDNLFIGSRTGMYIFDASNPERPVQTATFEHARSCDPVIVDNDIAYVTLRSGSECEGFTNQLDVVNVQSLTEPLLIKSFNMQNPHGLGKDGDLLFIAEGDYGLKIFNASNPLTIGDHLIKHYDNIHAFDVIPLNGILLMTGEDGLYQYDYSDPANITLLSAISITPEL